MVTELEDTFEKRYKMRALGNDGLNTVVSIPRIVLEREARKRDITIEEFIANYTAVAHFDGIEGVHYTFEKTESNGKSK